MTNNSETALLTIVSGDTRLGFSGIDGSLTSIKGGDGRELRKDTAPPLWRIEIGDKWCVGRVGPSEPGSGEVHAASFRSSPGRYGDRSLALTWNFDNPQVYVLVEITAPAGGNAVLLNLKVRSGAGRSFTIGDVQFPNVGGMTGDPATNCLAWPQDAGRLIPRPLDGGRWEGRFPGLAMQFVAFYSNWGGVYLGAHDGKGYTKDFRLNANGRDKGLSFSLYHFQENAGRTVRAYTHPYPAAIATFHGDWQAASEIYRPWARKQRWCRLGTLAEREDCSWIKDCPLFYYAKNWPLPVPESSDLYRYGEKTVTPLSQAVSSLREMMQISNPIGMHWSGWNGKGDGDNPDWTPRPETVAGLTSEIPKIRSKGFHILAYYNGRAWAEGEHGWDPDGLANVCIEDGRPADNSTYAGFDGKQRHLVAMCPGTSYWQERVASEAARVCEFHGDGAYIDQCGSNPAVLCEAQQHGHPARGGKWWQEGYHRAFARLRREAAQRGIRDFALSTEGCSELYIDCLHLFLSQSWADGIPMFQYVYHPYVYVYNMASWISNPIEDLRGKYAIALNQGSIIEEAEQGEGLNNGAYFRPRQDDPAKIEKIALLRTYVQQRARMLKYLNLGEMLRTPAVRGDVVCSAWRAADGDMAFVFSNPTAEPAGFSWVMDPCWYRPRPGGQWRVSVGGQPRDISLEPPVTPQEKQFTIGVGQTLVVEWQVEKKH